VIYDLGQRYWQVGDDNIGEIQCLNLQGKNPRSGLNWLCMEMALLKILFCERGLSLE
jgi:hypothetical protein